MTLLVDATGRLLRAGRVDSSVPELAAEAGVGTATAYRHVRTPSEALRAYSERAVRQLVEALSALDPELDPVVRFRRHCEHWVAQAREWGPAVRHIRSHQGYVERLVDGDASIGALHRILAAALDDLVRVGRMPSADPVYAVLIWVTVFDERVVYDLAEHHHWDDERITAELSGAVAGALGIRL